MNQRFNITSANPSRTKFLGFQELKLVELNHDWRVGELNQHYVISHTFVRITLDEIDKLISTNLAHSSPTFSFLPSPSPSV